MRTVSDMLAEIPFREYASSVAKALDEIDAARVLANHERILVKPNLVAPFPFPVTTHPDMCRAVVKYIQQAAPEASIVIAEGCGSMHHETAHVFERLGYARLAEELGTGLVDLNNAPTVTMANPACSLFPEMTLPEMAFTHLIVSVPVLKRHSLARITGTLKNMMGFLPPSRYSGAGGSWKKAAFHMKMHQSIKELCQYRTPDLSIMDATVGLAEHYLGGAACNPPVNRILASFDPLAMDRRAAGLLGLDWRDIGHLRREDRLHG